MKLNRLENTSLRARAARAIRANITTGQLRPGQLYSVGPVAASLGVSATPVREALFDLAAEGLVEIVKNRGFRVPVLTDRDLDEIFSLRLMIEVPPLVDLIGRLSQGTLVTCRRLVEQNEAAARRGDLTRFLETDRLFHTELLKQLDNRRLLELVERLRDATRLDGLVKLKGSPQLVDSSREHGRLLDALALGDRKAVADLMTRHLQHTRGMWAGRAEPDLAREAETQARSGVALARRGPQRAAL